MVTDILHFPGTTQRSSPKETRRIFTTCTRAPLSEGYACNVVMSDLSMHQRHNHYDSHNGFSPK